MTPNEPTLSQRIANTAAELKHRLGQEPRVAMLLGTGHTSIAGQLKNRVTLKSEDLPAGINFSENSPLLAGELEGIPVVIADAPLACHEGHPPEAVTFPVRVLQAMGVELLCLSAGGASLSLQLEPGTIAVVEDHINLSGFHPLQGPYDPDIGPGCHDMSDPYPSRWREIARGVAIEAGIPCLHGVYAAIPGPSLPTRAEYRFLKRVGADLVGMALVPEVLAAVHCGIDVLALVGVTQMVALESHRPVSIESMVDAADLAAPRMAAMIAGIVRTLPR
ncbi:MAG: purine-nucleoside phosphorylase [Planctomycetota bacterium]|nr:purine-nucleoside phosphorylase [Planctomycetota bacterium]